MNIKGQGHSLTFIQGHSDSTFSNFFSLETIGPIEAKFYVEPPWDGERVCSNDPDHMKKWPPCPYRVKTFKSLPRWNQKANGLETWYQHRILKYYQICSNDDPGLTLTCFMTDLVPFVFCIGKCSSCRFPRNY